MSDKIQFALQSLWINANRQQRKLNRKVNNFISRKKLIKMFDRVKISLKKFYQSIQGQIYQYIFKAAVVLACVVGCIWQIGIILHLYFAYQTTVFVYVEKMETLPLPGITLCNGNR